MGGDLGFWGGVPHPPFAIDEFGDAEIPPAGHIGALDGGVGGHLGTKAVHQLLQLSAWGGTGGGSGDTQRADLG